MKKNLIKKIGTLGTGTFLAANLFTGCSESPEKIINQRTTPIEIVAQSGDTRGKYARNCDCLNELDRRAIEYEIYNLNDKKDPIAGENYTILQCKNNY